MPLRFSKKILPRKKWHEDLNHTGIFGKLFSRDGWYAILRHFLRSSECLSEWWSSGYIIWSQGRITIQKMLEKIYHIYAKQNCLFHSLKEEEFYTTWNTLKTMVGIMKTDYSLDDLSYEELLVNREISRETSNWTPFTDTK
jgi:hypothetical protein